MKPKITILVLLSLMLSLTQAVWSVREEETTEKFSKQKRKRETRKENARKKTRIGGRITIGDGEKRTERKAIKIFETRTFSTKRERTKQDVEAACLLMNLQNEFLDLTQKPDEASTNNASSTPINQALDGEKGKVDLPACQLFSPTPGRHFPSKPLTEDKESQMSHQSMHQALPMNQPLTHQYLMHRLRCILAQGEPPRGGDVAENPSRILPHQLSPEEISKAWEGIQIETPGCISAWVAMDYEQRGNIPRALQYCYKAVLKKNLAAERNLLRLEDTLEALFGQTPKDISLYEMGFPVPQVFHPKSLQSLSSYSPLDLVRLSASENQRQYDQLSKRHKGR